MVTRRDVLAGAVGGSAALGSWLVGSTVADELVTTTVGYAILRNTTTRRQSIEVQLSRNGTPVFWERYELDPEQVIEPDHPEEAGDYRLFVRWDETIRSQQLESGERAVARVLVTIGDWDVILRDVPLSWLSPSQRTLDYAGNIR